MNQKLFIIFTFIISLTYHAFSSSFTLNEEGTEFWICFPMNYKNFSNNTEFREVSVQISARQLTDVKVTFSSTGISNKYIIPKDSTLIVIVPTDYQASEYDTITKKSIHIESDKPIYVKGFNHMFQTSDSYTALPTSMLGVDYSAISYHNSEGMLSQFGIVATEDNTIVTIIPATNTLHGHAYKSEYNVNLNRGDVYVTGAWYKGETLAIGPPEDQTGTTIKSNKPISVFSGHECSNIPFNTVACNHLVEQLPPTKFFGSEFITGKFAMRSIFTLRLLAINDNTDIRINSKWRASINKGEYFEDTLKNESIHIETTQPVLAAKYSHGFKGGDSVGDPTMLILRSVKNYQKVYIINTPINKNNWHHYVAISILKGSLSTLKMNGKSIEKGLFKEVQGTNYMFGKIKIEPGTYRLEAEKPFGIYSYGFGNAFDTFDAYGNM